MTSTCNVTFERFAEILSSAGISFPERDGYTLQSWAEDSAPDEVLPLTAQICQDAAPAPTPFYLAIWAEDSIVSPGNGAGSGDDSSTPAGPAAVRSGADTLANTGSSAGLMALGGIGALTALVAGAVLLLARRRA